MGDMTAKPRGPDLALSTKNSQMRRATAAYENIQLKARHKATAIGVIDAELLATNITTDLPT